MKNFFAVIGVLCLIPLMFIYSSFAWGFVMYKFYYWFIFPIFTGLPMITFTMAIGLSFFAGLFKNHGPINFEKRENEERWVRAITNILVPWLVLLAALFSKWIFNF